MKGHSTFQVCPHSPPLFLPPRDIFSILPFLSERTQKDPTQDKEGSPALLWSILSDRWSGACNVSIEVGMFSEVWDVSVQWRFPVCPVCPGCTGWWWSHFTTMLCGQSNWMLVITEILGKQWQTMFRGWAHHAFLNWSNPTPETLQTSLSPPEPCKVLENPRKHHGRDLIVCLHEALVGDEQEGRIRVTHTWDTLEQTLNLFLWQTTAMSPMAVPSPSQAQFSPLGLEDNKWSPLSIWEFNEGIS